PRADLAQHRARVALDLVLGHALGRARGNDRGSRGIDVRRSVELPADRVRTDLLRHRDATSFRAACRRSGVTGTCAMRTPQASWIALRIAGAVATSAGSPTPLAPYGPRGSGSSIRCVTIGGMSPAVGIR